MTETEISVEVKSGFLPDKGKGIARLDRDSMKLLDLSSGDIIEIQGQRKTYSKCLPRLGKDYDDGVLNIDKNSGCTCELFGNVERLGEEPGYPPGPVDHQFVLF